MNHRATELVWVTWSLPLAMVASGWGALWLSAWWPAALGFGVYMLGTPIFSVMLIRYESTRATGQIALVLWVLMVAVTLTTFAGIYFRL